MQTEWTCTSAITAARIACYAVWGHSESYIWGSVYLSAYTTDYNKSRRKETVDYVD